MQSITARHIMTDNPIAVSEDMSVSDLVKIFRDRMISGAPVVNNHGSLTGMVSLRDIALSGTQRRETTKEGVGYCVQGGENRFEEEEIDGYQFEYDSDLNVEHIMTPLVFSVSPEAPLQEIADTMLKGRVHRLAVTENERLAGIVTTMDILKVVRDNL